MSRAAADLAAVASAGPQAVLLQADGAAREEALALDSFIVEAPAGAGKTELLTQRFLRLLATAEEPEEVLALTFTNKAAGEMRERILAALERARQAAPEEAAAASHTPEPAHKQRTRSLAAAALARAAARGWQLEQQPGRLRLTTLDALCASLARQMPLLSRFGTQPALAEDAGRHYQVAALRALDHLEDGDDYAEAVAVALEYLDNDGARLAALLAAMLARREQWAGLARLDDPEAAIEAALAAVVTQELGEIAAVLDARWQQGVMPLARYAAAQAGGGALLDWAAPLATDSAALPLWRALATLCLTQEDGVRRSLNKNNGFPSAKDSSLPAEAAARKEAMLALLAALTPAQSDALCAIRRLPQARAGHDAVVRALARLARLAAAELWLVFREAGEVDFVELAARATAALGEGEAPSELALRLDYRIRHILVDEFQDTSPAQIELLARLTAGWQPGDGRTLFLVGDPMQSIYRFRKADVGLFLQAARQGIAGLPLTPLRLSRNNRSCAAVVDWINLNFPTVFPPRDEPVRGEICYRPFVATRDALPDAGVSLHAVAVPVDPGEGEAVAGAGEAARVLAIIAAERAADPARRIAVLVRAKDHLAPLVAALRRDHPEWRYSAVEIEPLAGRQVVQDLMALTRALHHRADRVHWLAVLRAPWCGLTLADLHALVADAPEATVPALLADDARLARLTPDGAARARHVRGVLGEALAGQGRQRCRPWIEQAWRRLGGPACLADDGEAQDAEACLARLDVLDAAGRFSLDALDADMEKLFAAPDPQADGRLQLMSIHKSKGLEFDTVIVPGLHRVAPPPDTPLLLWESFALAGGERLVVAPLKKRGAAPARARGGGDEAPGAYDFLQAIERERGRNESARVLYVAATRAIRHLHLVAAIRIDEAGAAKAPDARSALALMPGVAAALQAAALAAEAPAAAAAPARGALADFVAPLRRLAVLPVAGDAPPPPAMTVAEDGTEDAFAAAVGTLVHAVLEQAVTAPAAWTLAALAERSGHFERWLAMRGWSGDEARQGAARARELLGRALASADGQWVLQRRATDDGAEIALAAALDGGLVTRVVDRSFIDDGVRWIVDYKTAEYDSVERLPAQAERHRAQLAGYAALFPPQPPCRLAVFFVAHGRLVTLAPAAPDTAARSTRSIE